MINTSILREAAEVSFTKQVHIALATEMHVARDRIAEWTSSVIGSQETWVLPQLCHCLAV